MSRELRDITNTTLSAQSVRRHLRKAGPRAVVKKKKKPLLSTGHRQARLKFALEHQEWTLWPMDD